MKDQGTLIVVSNRLPVTVERAGVRCRVRPSDGGLVRALLPVVRENGGCWIGWPGTDSDPEVVRALRNERAAGYSLEPVFLNEAEKRCFYYGWSNEIVWPLFHDLPSNCTFDPEYWTAFRETTERFADAVESIAGPRDLIWVHDYHLMMLGESLRARGLRARTAYFHHIPFPAPDIFEKLPWRSEILRGLLQFNSLGFQTRRDSANFVACLERCFPETQVEALGTRTLVRAQGHCTTVGAFPISIDVESIATDAASPEVEAAAAAIRDQMAGKRLVLGLDRLDYTKGILQRLEAFRTLLARDRSLHGKVSLLQMVVPSRECIERYRDLKDAIEQAVSRINGEYGAPGWTPVLYWHRSLPRTELLALYRAADVAFITPLKDGMNLVAKEFCAARVDGTGALVLSEFAGAAAELKAGALLVNPYDAEGMCDALARALRMSLGEQHSRMQWMRATLARADVYAWFSAVCREAGFSLRRGQALRPTSQQAARLAMTAE